ncbi:MAG TPA: hypothetical protein VNC50_20145, partial [Planctomycetia bacterium]|nr:hypothetical protein [Planctomycetia bacterium]
MKLLPRMTAPFRVFLLLTLPALMWLGGNRIFAPSADERIARAKDLLEAGDFKNAAAQLDYVIYVEPYHAQALLDRGRVAMKKG